MFELARENPWLSRAVLFVLAAAALTALGLGGTAAGDLVAPLFGPLDPAAEAGFGRNLLVGVMLAGALLANLEFLRLLLFRWQVLVVWGELLLLFYRSEEQTSELQSLRRISYAVFCLKKKHNIPYH